MEFNTARGLRFTNKAEYAGKMFMTDFEEGKAKNVIIEMKEALKKLPLYYTLNGNYALDAQAGEQKLQAIANDNLELYLYGLKAVVLRDRYFVSANDVDNTNRIFQECLGAILRNAINSDAERWMPVFKHILQVWPHSRYWGVVNDVLCRAYAEINVLDAECVRIVAHGLLRDPNSWRAAFDAMMIRARMYKGETIAQFSEIFDFLNIYGQSPIGKDGISIPQNIYSSGSSTMKLAFEDQEAEVKQELRDLGAITIGANGQIRSYLSRMFGITGTGEDFGNLEALYKNDPEAAKRAVLENFDVRGMVGWEKLQSPEIIEWMGQKMANPRYSIAEKQILGYRLFRARRQNQWVKSEAPQLVRDILYKYRTVDDSDQEYVLAGCFKMLAVASDSRYNVDSDAIQQDMIELLMRHSNMEVNQRNVLDKKSKGAIWYSMISSYSLSFAIRNALASIISDTDLSNVEAVRKMFKVVADTFSPLELRNPYVLREAVPHMEIKRVLKGFLALDRERMNFRANYEFLREVLPKILDALEAISIQETYDSHYREIVGHFHIYCTTLDDSRRCRIHDSYDRIMCIINNFPLIAGG